MAFNTSTPGTKGGRCRGSGETGIMMTKGSRPGRRSEDGDSQGDEGHDYEQKDSKKCISQPHAQNLGVL